MKRAATATISLFALLSLLLSSASQAGEFSFGGGAFFPAKGDIGYTLRTTLMTSDPKSHWRWGAELEYRKYDSTYVGIDRVRTQDVLVNGIVHWRLFPEGWTPYGGLGLGLGVNILDSKRLDQQLPLFRNFKINKVGFMLGVLALIGVEVPIGTHFAWYAEARGDIYSRIPPDGDTSWTNASGGDVSTGFRLRY